MTIQEFKSKIELVSGVKNVDIEIHQEECQNKFSVRYTTTIYVYFMNGSIWHHVFESNYELEMFYLRCCLYAK